MSDSYSRSFSPFDLTSPRAQHIKPPAETCLVLWSPSAMLLTRKLTTLTPPNLQGYPSVSVCSAVSHSGSRSTSESSRVPTRASTHVRPISLLFSNCVSVGAGVHVG